MPKWTDETVEFGRVGRRVIEAAFDGGDIVSDGGVLLRKRVDERLGLTGAAAKAFGEERRGASVQHSLHSLVAQRIYGLCLRRSDGCDHNVLRNDLVIQTAVGRAEPLASAPTLSRLETGATPEHAAALHEVLMQLIIASHAKAPKELVLDVDATYVPLHGGQERGHFHACYDNCGCLPLQVFAGQDMLACELRPSDRDPTSVLSALIKRLRVPLRRAWPETKIIVRADSGFCRPRVLRRLERWGLGLGYIIGLQKNSRLAQQVELAELALAERYARRQTKQRRFGEFGYAALTWDKPRRVIARLENGEQGANPRFIVTDLPGSAKALYERRYCARGEAENRIKEAQFDLFGRRASCRRFQANQLRLLLAVLAYTLMIKLRRPGLKGTELARACTTTIRTRLLKIGAAIVRMARPARVLLASAHPMKHGFIAAARALSPKPPIQCLARALTPPALARERNFAAHASLRRVGRPTAGRPAPHRGWCLGREGRKSGQALPQPHAGAPQTAHSPQRPGLGGLPARGGFVVESRQTAILAMKTDQRPVTPIATADAKVQQRRRAGALAAAAGAAVGVGALLGHGLGTSVANALPTAWQSAVPALVGAAVAALLVPLAGWAAIRIVAPTLPAPRAKPAAPAVVTPLRAAAAAARASTQAADQASAGAVDAQAPARDALTGAYTQQHFVAAADREWSRIRRHGEDAALLMIDVDHFKPLNDAHGTACGDAMLVEITRLASTTLRPYDLLARFSGGVLVVYLPHTDPLGALDVAERIRERVAGLALLWQGARVKATVSVGVAGIGASHGGLDSVIADAGTALREAKSAGRNCVRAAPIPPKRDPAPARSAG